MPPRIWIPRSAAFTRVFGGDHLQHVRLDTTFLAGALQPRRVVQHELGLLAHGRDIGNVVLQDLEAANDLAEGLALLGRTPARLPTHRRSPPRHWAPTMIRSLLSVGSSMYQARPGSPSTSSSGTNTFSMCTWQETHRPHAQLGQQGCGHALLLRRQEEQCQALVTLPRRSCPSGASNRM